MPRRNLCPFLLRHTYTYTLALIRKRRPYCKSAAHKIGTALSGCPSTPDRRARPLFARTRAVIIALARTHYGRTLITKVASSRSRVTGKPSCCSSSVVEAANLSRWEVTAMMRLLAVGVAHRFGVPTARPLAHIITIISSPIPPPQNDVRLAVSTAGLASPVRKPRPLHPSPAECRRLQTPPRQTTLPHMLHRPNTKHLIYSPAQSG